MTEWAVLSYERFIVRIYLQYKVECTPETGAGGKPQIFTSLCVADNVRSIIHKRSSFYTSYIEFRDTGISGTNSS